MGAVAIGCASPSGRGHVAAPPPAGEFPAAAVLMVLPLNIPLEIPAGLEGPSLAVFHELENFLRAHDKGLKTVAYLDAKRLWAQSVAQARQAAGSEAPDFTRAMGLLAVELRRHAEFDAMVVPSIFIQKAALSGAEARWDGVVRPIELRRERPVFQGHRMRASRTARSASLHVAVFDASGRLLHAGQGGLDVLVRGRIDERYSQQYADGDYWYFEPRPEVFGDPALLLEGVERAFQPYLTSSTAARSPL